MSPTRRLTATPARVASLQAAVSAATTPPRRQTLTNPPAATRKPLFATLKPVVVPTIAPQEAAKYAVITVGTKSDAVLALKERLTALGYFRPVSPSREYTDSTAKTIIRFQELNGLPQTGVADAKTQALLFSALAIAADGGRAQAASASTGRTTVQRSASSSSSIATFAAPVATRPRATVAPTAKPQTITRMVWIPRTGSKYHSSASCSNMKNPRQVTQEEAIRRNYGRCKKCW